MRFSCLYSGEQNRKILNASLSITTKMRSCYIKQIQVQTQKATNEKDKVSMEIQQNIGIYKYLSKADVKLHLAGGTNEIRRARYIV